MVLDTGYSKRDNGEQHKPKGGTIGTIIIGAAVAVVAIVVLLFFIRWLYPSAESVRVSFGVGKYVEIEMPAQKLDYKNLIRSLFENEELKILFDNELKTTYDIYHIDDPDLIKELESTRHIYQIDDVDLSKKLSELFPENYEEDFYLRSSQMNSLLEKHPVIRDLREKSKRHEPPFQFVGQQVKFGLPANPSDRPKAGFVNATIGSQFVGKIIEIRNPDRPNLCLTLEGRAAFARTDIVDMQLNEDQVDYLFGTMYERTVTGIVFVLPEGAKISDPSVEETAED